jgi:hypothetical protein
MFTKTQTALLRTYHTGGFTEDQLVEISADHDFEKGPYQDTVGFAVGSNQTIFRWSHFYSSCSHLM